MNLLRVSFLENIVNGITYGGKTAIIGILIVFVGLGIIIGTLYAMAAVFQALDKKKKADEEAAAAAKAAEAAKAAASAPAPAPVAEVVAEEVTDDSELIAVIAAAIAAYDFGNKPVKIKSVRRMSGWQNAARAEQVFKF